MTGTLLAIIVFAGIAAWLLIVAVLKTFVLPNLIQAWFPR